MSRCWRRRHIGPYACMQVTHGALAVRACTYQLCMFVRLSLAAAETHRSSINVHRTCVILAQAWDPATVASRIGGRFLGPYQCHAWIPAGPAWLRACWLSSGRDARCAVSQVPPPPSFGPAPTVVVALATKNRRSTAHRGPPAIPSASAGTVLPVAHMLDVSSALLRLQQPRLRGAATENDAASRLRRWRPQWPGKTPPDAKGRLARMRAGKLRTRGRTLRPCASTERPSLPPREHRPWAARWHIPANAPAQQPAWTCHTVLDVPRCPYVRT